MFKRKTKYRITIFPETVGFGYKIERLVPNPMMLGRCVDPNWSARNSYKAYTTRGDALEAATARVRKQREYEDGQKVFVV